MHGCFVTGTDSGAGKTVLAAAIAASCRARGRRVRAFKPVITGLAVPSDPAWPHDDELLAAASGIEPGDVAPLRFGPAVSPHLAASLTDTRIDPAAIVAAARAAGARAEVLVVEGVGGLLVPLTPQYSVRDLARELGLPVVIAARPGLGTINHTLLTAEAAKAVGLRVVGVALTPWPREPGVLERSNRESLEQMLGVPVATIARIARADVELLAWAGSSLPLDEWLGDAVATRIP